MPVARRGRLDRGLGVVPGDLEVLDAGARAGRSPWFTFAGDVVDDRPRTGEVTRAARWCRCRRGRPVDALPGVWTVCGAAAAVEVAGGGVSSSAAPMTAAAPAAAQA